MANRFINDQQRETSGKRLIKIPLTIALIFIALPVTIIIWSFFMGYWVGLGQNPANHFQAMTPSSNFLANSEQKPTQTAIIKDDIVADSLPDLAKKNPSALITKKDAEKTKVEPPIIVKEATKTEKIVPVKEEPKEVTKPNLVANNEPKINKPDTSVNKPETKDKTSTSTVAKETNAKATAIPAIKDTGTKEANIVRAVAKQESPKVEKATKVVEKPTNDLPVIAGANGYIGGTPKDQKNTALKANQVEIERLSGNNETTYDYLYQIAALRRENDALRLCQQVTKKFSNIYKLNCRVKAQGKVYLTMLAFNATSRTASDLTATLEQMRLGKPLEIQRKPKL